MNEFLSQLAKGEMPELAPISWASSYNANDTTWLLQAGGLELLEIDTIARIKEVDSIARTDLSTMAHYQQLSDQLIVPHLAEGRSFFYEPATKQLRNMACGISALAKNTIGKNNLGVGLNAGANLTSGNNNIALGFGGGSNLTTGNITSQSVRPILPASPTPFAWAT